MDHMVIRRNVSHADGTFGTASWNNTPFCLTLERPWLDNQRGVSCIPAGRYIALRCRNSPDYNFKDSPGFGDTFQVFMVPGRSKILFHKGNIDDDTHGCIILGEEYGTYKGKVSIMASAKAFDEFKRLTEGKKQFLLDIFDLTAVPLAA